MTYRYVFWLHKPSVHVAPLAAALAAREGTDVYVVCEHPYDGERSRLGAGVCDHGDARFIVSSEPGERGQLVRELGPGSFHLLTGLGVYPSVTASMRLLAAERDGRQLAVFSEPWRSGGWKGLFRGLKFHRHWRALGGDLDRVLAAGLQAKDQFTRLAGGAKRVHEFAYFVASNEQVSPPPRSPSEVVAFTYVGQLIERKNVELLIRAVAALGRGAVSLDVVGDGPLRQELQSLAQRLGVRCHFSGPMDNGEVREVLARSDLLVLPSYFDGWGAVVNEALLSGVPCVVSDRVGAQALITDPRLGSVFRSGRRSDLVTQLGRWAGRGPLPAEERARIRAWAEHCISANAGAEYLATIASAEGELVAPPWRRNVAVSTWDQGTR